MNIIEVLFSLKKKLVVQGRSGFSYCAVGIRGLQSDAPPPSELGCGVAPPAVSTYLGCTS